MPEPIRKKLRAYRARIRTAVVAKAFAWTVVVVVCLVFLSLVLDYFQEMSRAARAFALAVGLVVIGGALYRLLVAKLLRPMDDERIALTVEDRFPELRGRLISALQFAPVLDAGTAGRSGQSLVMMSAVAAEAAAAVEPLRLGGTIHVGRLVRGVLAAGIACAAVAAMCFVTIEDIDEAGRAHEVGLMKRWFQRNVLLMDIAWPQRTHFDVRYPGVVPRGDTLRVAVTVSGEIPDEVWIRHRFRPSGKRGERRMVPTGDLEEHTFEIPFKNLNEEVEFQVFGGRRARTRWHRVRLVERPAITQLKFWAVYPYYTGLPPRPLTAGESYLELLPGTTLRVAAVASKPLRSASMVLDDQGAPVSMIPLDDKPNAPRGVRKPSWQTRRFWFPPAEAKRVSNVWVGSVSITRDCFVALRVVDAHGLRNRPPTRFTVRVVPDKAPVVVLRVKGIGDMVVPNATIPLEFRVTDDYGVRRLSLHHKFVIGDKASPGEDVIEFKKLVYGGRTVKHDWRWNLADLGLQPGSVLMFHAEAADNKDTPPENVGKTETVSLRVVKPDELMADLVRRQIEQRQAFERIHERERLEIKIEIDALEKIAREKTLAELGEKRLARLAAVEENVRHNAEEVRHVANMLEQVLLEMIHNKLGDADDRSRLRDGIVGPCRELAQKWMPELAAGLQAAAVARGSDLRKRLARTAEQSNRVLDRMNRVLTNMVKMETFRRIVEQARKIKKAQEELYSDIEKEYNDILRSVLGETLPR